MGPGDSIDVWVIEAALGAGGMGSVYRCHNRSATRILAAVKVLDRALRSHPDVSRRFVREADILGQLDHRNIVKIRNVRHEHDPPYLEMEFVAGESVEARLRRGALRYEEALSLVRQAADALAYLHERNVRHRDLKPGNLLLQADGTLKVVDFGLAVELDHSRITQEGTAFGTVAYAPPEWVRPASVDPARWDLYALGVIFWECLTGMEAFPVSGDGGPRQQALQVMMVKQDHPPLDPGPGFPEAVRALCRDLTHPDPGSRLGDAAVVLARARALPEHLRPGGANVTLTPSALDEAGPASLPEVVLPPRPDRPSPTWLPAEEPPEEVRAERPPEPERPATAVGGDRRRWALAAFGGLGLLAAVGAAGMLAIGGGAWAWLATGHRPLVVGVEGSGDARLVLLMDGEPVPAGPDGLWRAEVAVGSHRIRWVAGPCGDPCLEPCAACTSGEEATEVPRGLGEHRVDLVVSPPAPREVRLGLPGIPGEVPVVAALGGAEGRREGSELVFGGVAPGSAALTLAVGACPEAARGCWPEGACPPGCLDGTTRVEIPTAGPADPGALRLPFTPAGPAPRPGTPAPPSPEPSPAPRPRAKGGWVTVGMLADFLRANPSWGPGSERARAGGSGYLRGWTPEGPPQGLAPTAQATGVTGDLARRVCRGLGMDLPDDTDLADAVDLELRRDGEGVRLVERPEGGEARLVPVGNVAVTGARWRCRG